MLLVGIRYCGGCNPQIDRSEVVEGLKARLRKMGLSKVEFTIDKEKPIHILLLINGCTHACREEEYRTCGQSCPLISVKGEMVDDKYVEEVFIPGLMVDRIIELSEVIL